jgi:hypothetical protein
MYPSPHLLSLTGRIAPLRCAPDDEWRGSDVACLALSSVPVNGFTGRLIYKLHRFRTFRPSFLRVGVRKRHVIWQYWKILRPPLAQQATLYCLLYMYPVSIIDTASANRTYGSGSSLFLNCPSEIVPRACNWFLTFVLTHDC